MIAVHCLDERIGVVVGSAGRIGSQQILTCPWAEGLMLNLEKSPLAQI